MLRLFRRASLKMVSYQLDIKLRNLSISRSSSFVAIHGNPFIRIRINAVVCENPCLASCCTVPCHLLLIFSIFAPPMFRYYVQTCNDVCTNYQMYSGPAFPLILGTVDVFLKMSTLKVLGIIELIFPLILHSVA